jgi:hypothetical protein
VRGASADGSEWDAAVRQFAQMRVPQIVELALSGL